MLDRRICVATISWARSSSEEVLLRRALSLLAATGLPVAVADRGDNAPFVEFLQGLAGVHVVVPGKQGLVAQVQASISLASGFDCPFVLYVEPDKELFFRDGLSTFLDRALQAPSDGLILAARSDESFATYPPMQRYSETVVNHLCGELLGRIGDYCYGPFLMNRRLAGDAAGLDSTLGWGWRPSMFVSARRQGIGMRHVVADHPCPPDQRMEDESERRHRIRQLGENIRGLLA